MDIDTPHINVQAKNVKRNINYDKIFAEMSEELSKNLPDRLQVPLAIFHKKERNEYVIIPKETFYEMFSSYLNSRNNDNQK